MALKPSAPHLCRWLSSVLRGADALQADGEASWLKHAQAFPECSCRVLASQAHPHYVPAFPNRTHNSSRSRSPARCICCLVPASPVLCSPTTTHMPSASACCATATSSST